MITNQDQAPGRPGIKATWTSSAKSGVGTSLNPSSRVWFTLSHGIFDEIYYPRVDQACTRDMGFIVTDGDTFFAEEKRDANYKVEYLAEGVLGYRLINNCNQGRYCIVKEIISDPHRDVVLQQTSFKPLVGKLEDYHLYILLAPHIGNQGADNTAWIGEYKGVPMLFAQKDSTALALACSLPWKARSAGFVGVSDGWQDLKANKLMTWSYSKASHGNVALTGEIDLSNRENKEASFVLSLGFGTNIAEAGQRALASLLDGFDNARRDYIKEWQTWQKRLHPLDIKEKSKPPVDIYKVSTAVLRTHEAKRFPGGLIASLSIPWGFSRGDDDLGGYHLVWPRDLVETAGGLLAAGAKEDARRILYYLQVTQESDGHWPQNMWLDGRPYWDGIQMDETAFPILLVEMATREKALDKKTLKRLWPMVRRAAGFIVQNGPVTQQDRWEEDPGYSLFTLAVEIAALLSAADQADSNMEPVLGNYLRQTADAWNERIEHWTYVQGTDIAKKVGVEGYYVRISPPEEAEAITPADGFVPIKNRPPGLSKEPAKNIISPDALALVRFGLRSADDPRVINTTKVIDALLKVSTPHGPAWHRYNDDGYGEHEDGSPFDGTGIGRAWPLLTGERAHYELAAGHREEALRLLDALESFSNSGGMIPEQIWDSTDILERELYCGKPSGSAMPLVWAHAEYVKLKRSLSDGRVFDMPFQTVQRYITDKITSPLVIWRFNHKIRTIPAEKILRIEVLQESRIHWSPDNWHTIENIDTNDTSIGLYFADLPVNDLPPGTRIVFTFYWLNDDRWEGVDYSVEIEPG
jgi:glucoamylase